MSVHNWDFWGIGIFIDSVPVHVHWNRLEEFIFDVMESCNDSLLKSNEVVEAIGDIEVFNINEERRVL
jgi:hypothetical protein